MKLNVGCGDHYAHGWTNLDAHPGSTVRPDIVGDLTNLPSEVRGVTAVYLGHVLEHIPLTEVVTALRHLWKRCTPEAEVAIVGPDCDRARAMWAAGEIDEATADGAIHGACRWPGDEHLWECGQERLLTLVLASGLEGFAVPLDDSALDVFPVVSRVGWQCAVVGDVPEAASRAA